MVSPITDAAAAIVIASEHEAKRRTDKPIWIEGVGWCLDTSYWTNRDLFYPKYVEYAARMAYDMAGIKDPRKEIHVVEPYDPFAYKELHHLEGLLLADKGEAPKLLEKGFWDRDTEEGIPSCPSGKRDFGTGTQKRESPLVLPVGFWVLEIQLQLQDL